MPERHFTVEEANEALAEVRPLTERMVEHRRALRAAEQRHVALALSIGGNGGDIVPSELTEAVEVLEREGAALARCVAGINEVGGVVKDLDAGLVDFPAFREGEEVLLCWRLGEAEIGFWHGLDEGFAGRRPVLGEGFGRRPSN